VGENFKPPPIDTRPDLFSWSEYVPPARARGRTPHRTFRPHSPWLLSACCAPHACMHACACVRLHTRARAPCRRSRRARCALRGRCACTAATSTFTSKGSPASRFSTSTMASRCPGRSLHCARMTLAGAPPLLVPVAQPSARSHARGAVRGSSPLCFCGRARVRPFLAPP